LCALFYLRANAMSIPTIKPNVAIVPPCPYPPVPDRQPDGRFALGNSLGGKTKGARNRTTLAVEALMGDEAEHITRVCIDAAKKGDMVAAKIVLDRVSPVRKGRPVVIPGMPVVASIDDIPRAHAALIAAVANGDVTAEEAAPLSAMLAGFTNSLDAVALKHRLDELERRLVAAESGPPPIDGKAEPFTFKLDKPPSDAEQAYADTLKDGTN
jgi:hypothetical protein